MPQDNKTFWVTVSYSRVAFLNSLEMLIPPHSPKISLENERSPSRLVGLTGWSHWSMNSKRKLLVQYSVQDMRSTRSSTYSAKAVDRKNYRLKNQNSTQELNKETLQKQKNRFRFFSQKFAWGLSLTFKERNLFLQLLTN